MKNENEKSTPVRLKTEKPDGRGLRKVELIEISHKHLGTHFDACKPFCMVQAVVIVKEIAQVAMRVQQVTFQLPHGILTQPRGHKRGGAAHEMHGRAVI